MGFQSRFERREGGSVSDAFRKCIPEGGGGHRERSVAPGPAPGLLGDLEEAGVAGSEGTGWDMWLEEVREVGGGQVVKCFVGGKEHFEVDSLGNWEPVEVMEDWGDMVSGSGSGEEAGSGVLNILEFLDNF